MNRTFFILLAGLSWFQCSSAETAPSAPRLANLIKEIDTVNAPVSAEQEQRTAQYLSDLKTLEKRVQATGNLNKVLQVVNEREAWESGKPTPPIDPRDEDIAIGLRKLRYYFDKEINTIQTTRRMNSEKQRAEIRDKFDALEKLLTTEGKIKEAIETRKYKEMFVAGKLDPTPQINKSEAITVETMPSVAENSTKFPIPDPAGYPPLPGETCRIVIVHYNNPPSKTEPASYKKIERDDYTNVVDLAEFMNADEVAAILEDGRPVYWRRDGTKLDPRNVSAVKLWSGRFASLCWIDKDGYAGLISDNKQIEDDLKKLGKVRALYPDHHYAFAIAEDGTRHIIASGKIHPNVERAFAITENIVAPGYAGHPYIKILRNDGSLEEFIFDKEPKQFQPPGSVRKLLAFHTWQKTDGEYVISGALAPFVNEVRKIEKEILQIEGRSGFLTIQFPGKKWKIFHNEKGSVTNLSKFEKAFDGATSIRATGTGLVALLPSTTVPRSGLWDIDELIASRK